MSKKLYLSEFAVNLFSARWLITSANQFMSGGTMGAEEQDVANSCHIYLICKSPVVSFSKDSLKYENGNLSVKVNYRVEGEIRERSFHSIFRCLTGQPV